MGVQIVPTDRFEGDCRLLSTNGNKEVYVSALDLSKAYDEVSFFACLRVTG